MSVNLHDLPPRAEDEDRSYLVSNESWDRLQKYLKLITVKDDGSTSKVTEGKNGLIVSRAD